MVSSQEVTVLISETESLFTAASMCISPLFRTACRSVAFRWPRQRRRRLISSTSKSSLTWITTIVTSSSRSSVEPRADHCDSSSSRRSAQQSAIKMLCSLSRNTLNASAPNSIPRLCRFRKFHRYRAIFDHHFLVDTTHTSKLENENFPRNKPFSSTLRTPSGPPHKSRGG